MTDQTRPLSDSELPTFDRPVEIIENPYANANRSYTTQTYLFNEAIINKYNRSGPLASSCVYAEFRQKDTLNSRPNHCFSW